MEFMLASEKDAKELSYLKKEVWENTYRGIYDDNKIDNYDYLRREEKFKRLINDDEQEVYVCKDDNKIVGYMVLGKSLHEGLDGYDLTINDLGVASSYQRKGIGKNFIDIAKSKNKKLFNCCNFYNKKAQVFYEKMGAKVAKVEINDSCKAASQIYYVY